MTCTGTVYYLVQDPGRLESPPRICLASAKHEQLDSTRKWSCAAPVGGQSRVKFVGRGINRRPRYPDAPYCWWPSLSALMLLVICGLEFAPPALGEVHGGTTVFRGRELSYEVIGGLAVHGGDIVLGTAEAPAAASPRRVRPKLQEVLWPERRSAVREVEHVWPEGRIPYIIDSDVPDRQAILDAIAEWNTNTVITLQDRTSEENYVRFKADPGACRANLGMAGGEQFIWVNQYGVCEKNILIHEIGHSVGLWHEHQRLDRDRYLMVHEENVKFCSTPFALVAEAETRGAYDYASAMHYARGVFADVPWMDTIPPGMALTYRDPRGLSPGDIDKVARMYGSTPTATTISTNPPGLDIIVDGERVTTPASFEWQADSEHSLAAPSPQMGGNGARYLFGRWSDEGSRSHMVTADPAAASWFQASFIEQHRVVPVASPEAAGTVTIRQASPDGFYTVGTRLELSAAANPGGSYQFVQWAWASDREGYSISDSWLPGASWNPAYPVVGVPAPPGP